MKDSLFAFTLFVFFASGSYLWDFEKTDIPAVPCNIVLGSSLKPVDSEDDKTIKLSTVKTLCYKYTQSCDETDSDHVTTSKLQAYCESNCNCFELNIAWYASFISFCIIAYQLFS